MNQVPSIMMMMMVLMLVGSTRAFTAVSPLSTFSPSTTTPRHDMVVGSSSGSYLMDTTVTSPQFPAYTSGPAAVTTTTVANPPMVAQRWRKSTKQVATLGPASSSLAMIETLFLAGADVFRLNFSHGTTEQKQELVHIIRSIEEKYSHPIAILGDLQGPKLRVRWIELFFLSRHCTLPL